MTIARSQMNRQLYGIGNLVEREKYGIGSSLKKFVRNIIPNEVASVASAAAPFVAPFNPLLAAGMSALGNFDRTGSISGSLKSAALTYGGGQIARGIGGAGFQTGFNPFDAASLGQSASSFIGIPYSTPIGTQTGLQLGQYELFGGAPKTPIGIDDLSQVGVNVSGAGGPTGFGADLKTIFSPDSNVGLETRAKAAMSLTGDAIKAMYTNKDGTLDKRMVVSTLAAIPSYLDAKKKADQIGLSSNEFNEQIFNEQKAMFQTAYQSRLPMESFGIRTTAQMGGIMGAQQEEPIFPRLETLSKNLGQAETTLGEPSNQFDASSITTAITGQQPQGFADGGLLSIQLTPREGYFLGNLVSKIASGTVEPSSGQSSSGGGFGGLGSLIRQLISNNPNMFQQQSRTVSANPVTDLYKYYLDGGSDEDYKRKIMDYVKPRFGVAMGGEIPMRQNQGGITELDLRAKGGYIPVGIKEKADDVPAMLSKNEFVFTADAVRGAGNGSINKGAQKMYKLMKSLEKKVKKTKVA